MRKNYTARADGRSTGPPPEGLLWDKELGKLRSGEDLAEILHCDLDLEQAHPLFKEAIAHCESVSDTVSREILARILEADPYVPAAPFRRGVAGIAGCPDPTPDLRVGPPACTGAVPPVYHGVSTPLTDGGTPHR